MQLEHCSPSFCYLACFKHDFVFNEEGKQNARGHPKSLSLLKHCSVPSGGFDVKGERNSNSLFTRNLTWKEGKGKKCSEVSAACLLAVTFPGKPLSGGKTQKGGAKGSRSSREEAGNAYSVQNICLFHEAPWAISLEVTKHFSWAYSRNSPAIPSYCLQENVWGGCMSDSI